MKKAFLLANVSSFLLGLNIILNRRMSVDGEHWLWNVALFYLIMFPTLAILLKPSKLNQVHTEIRRDPVYWLFGSTVGFIVFYMFFLFSTNYGELSLVAAISQITIVAGILLTPLFGQKIPVRNLLLGFIILGGVYLIQSNMAHAVTIRGNLQILIPVTVAAFAFPLGNRMMMGWCNGRLNTIQRVYGMTCSCMPICIILTVVAYIKTGFPSFNQLLRSGMTAWLSGVIATSLFFTATDLVKDNPRQLAFIELTQVGEILISLLGGVWILGDKFPGFKEMLGITLILAGIIISGVTEKRIASVIESRC